MSSDSEALRGKAVLVSGGTQGVGGGIARAALAAGADVLVTGRRSDVGEQFVRDHGLLGRGRLAFHAADVADPAQARAGVAATVSTFGRIDGLVNAAGLTTRGTLLDTSPELFAAHIAVNLGGPFFTMQAAVEAMRARGAGGSIVNIISLAAHGGQPYLAPYVAAKAGLAGLTRNAAHSHRWDRIRVNGINIGWTQTEGEDSVQRAFHGAADGWADDAASSLPMGRLGQVDDVGRLAVLLLSEGSGVVTGSVIDWDQTVVGAFD